MRMKTTTLKYGDLKNFINGGFSVNGEHAIPVFSPVDGSVLATVPMGTAETLNAAVAAAKQAFPAWSSTPIKERIQVFYTYRQLLLQHVDELSQLITEENGKTYSEAKAEIEKAIELTEFAC